MKLTKKDIVSANGLQAVYVSRLREVVKELSSRRQGDEHGHAWIMERDIYDLCGEVLEEREIKENG